MSEDKDKGMEVEFLKGSPTIIIPFNVKYDMDLIIASCEKEIGWLGIIKPDWEKWTFTIERVFVPPQGCHYATTEILKLDQTIFKMLKDGTLKDEEINSIRMWGHSHPNFSTSPSGQDESQMTDFIKDVHDFYIRVIGNKKGEYSWKLYLFQYGIAITDVPTRIVYTCDASREKFWQAEVKEKVKELGYGSSNTTHGRCGFQGGYGEYGASWEGDEYYRNYGDPKTSRPGLVKKGMEHAVFHRDGGFGYKGMKKLMKRNKKLYSFQNKEMQRGAVIIHE